MLAIAEAYVIELDFASLSDLKLIVNYVSI